jgi:hypothetical protein
MIFKLKTKWKEEDYIKPKVTTKDIVELIRNNDLEALNHLLDILGEQQRDRELDLHA